MQVAGLNHFIFVRQILHKGKEWLPEVIAEINAGRDPLVPRNIPPFRWPSHLLQGLGMIPCAYLRYYYMKDDLLRQELAEAGGEGTRGEVVKQLEKILFDQYRDPHLAVKPKALGNRHTAWRALMLNPLIVSGEKLELALDEVIAENRQWLPAFHA